ncbi:hypothetical protein ABEF79_07115 [Acinetobacter sp. ANC 7454]|uniref:hypothetical protein n=1 Tax=Acinetobacter thermotolerans TaxID=3151487 RepID=UPI00325B1C24
MLKQQIFDYVKKMKGNVSFVELQKQFPQIKGDFDYAQPEYNLLFWWNVTEEFITAINELILENKIYFKLCEPLVYIGDGVIIDHPIAKEFKRYESPRWYPMVFSVL